MVVSPYVPFPLSHGGAVRIYNLIHRAARDFDQILVCFTDELQSAPKELTRYLCRGGLCQTLLDTCNSRNRAARHRGRVRFTGFHAVLRQTMRKWHPESHNSNLLRWPSMPTDCAPARTILVEHDITLDLYSQLLAQRDDWETRRQHDRWVRFEKQAWTRVDRVITMSDKDRSTIPSSSAATVPNGVDLERFQPSAEAPDPRRILFIGSFAHLPNVLAIDFFIREVWPLLQPIAPTLHVIAGSRPEYFLDHYKQRVEPHLTINPAST